MEYRNKGNIHRFYERAARGATALAIAGTMYLSCPSGLYAGETQHPIESNLEQRLAEDAGLEEPGLGKTLRNIGLIGGLAALGGIMVAAVSGNAFSGEGKKPERPSGKDNRYLWGDENYYSWRSQHKRRVEEHRRKRANSYDAYRQQNPGIKPRGKRTVDR